MKLVPIDSAEAERIDTSVEPEIGQWFWLRVKNRDDEDTKQMLVCITHVGSNYVAVTGPNTGDKYSGEDGTTTWRVHFDRFDSLLTPEPDPISHIELKIGEHKTRARELLHEIKQLTASLGLSNQRLGAGPDESTTALAVASSTENIHAHKAALIKAKTETLPELFKRVEDEHKWLVKWMKTKMIPEKARFAEMKDSIALIDGRIFTVELYAGLVEDLVRIADGDPAPISEKMHLFQRRHYMDEECLVNYKAGGMSFKSLAKFDAWLATPENRDRILPKPRSIVAFQIRRKDRRHDDDWEQPSVTDWITFHLEARYDKLTFLYIRNGEQIWRLGTEIEFGEQLFPDAEHNELLGGGQLYWYHNKLITERELQDLIARKNEIRARHAAELKAWKKAPKKSRGPKPWHSGPSFEDDPSNYEKLNPSSVYYDDGMEELASMIRKHNQIATILQGVLDRSPALHPHPPTWRLWTPEGFLAAIALIYDDSRALVDGDAPDFEAYRARLNASLVRGSMTVGQEDQWELHEGAKETARMDRSWRTRRDWRPKRHRPYGNPGPGLIAEIKALGRDGVATFEWKRERQTFSRYHNSEEDITTRFRCPTSKLLNVSAYQAGDFKIFYNDPRTRQLYFKWAPLLLAAEDYVNGKKQGENMQDPEEESTDE